MTQCEFSILDFNVSQFLTKILGFIHVILCEFSVSTLWALWSLPLSPRLQCGVTLAMGNLGTG